MHAATRELDPRGKRPRPAFDVRPSPSGRVSTEGVAPGEGYSCSQSLERVNRHALGTLVSLLMLIFFSPSNRRNDSKAGGAFMVLS
ncbi:hypothetical protein EYF80_037469 [Liparis tanakae]|uniref:Uncharacterized protein n=1 Tax=Liparis tanakae TaxID=230148 RepID=A0A4Z2GGQ8_9TELE|nr:hypothetical protein EYF80_037469 [Liparis tanakae]